jgi:predicted enzyme related to lactoylglutathione lyase
MFLDVRRITLSVPDIPKAQAWYAELLGFEPAVRESSFVRFCLGGHDLDLIPRTGRTSSARAATVITWRVNRIERSLAKLVRLGATVPQPIHYVADAGLMASVVDPFGNPIELLEERIN